MPVRCLVATRNCFGTKLASLTTLALIAALASSRTGDAAEPASPAVDWPTRQRIVERGIGYLQSKGQDADGSYSKQAGIGITALVTTAVMQNGRSPSDPLVAKSLAYLEKHVQPDGGIYGKGSRLKNYETCLAMICFQRANRDGRYDKQIAKASKFVRGLQIEDGDDATPADLSYGGATYGGEGRPDLSNTSFLIEALKASGASADDPAIQKALLFVSRCQNLETEHNTTPFAAKNPDGGFYYTCAAGGVSPADKTPEGGLRSYGSMTYAGLKSMIFAGVDADDPRVKAATAWIEQHYDLDANPGLGTAGLYYYYNLFAKALDATELNTLTDAQGQKHNWRAELVAELAERQRGNGSWVNDNERWMETDPNLVTGFALMALSYCRPADARQ